MLIRGLLFDLDGTLTRPRLDFAAIKAELGAPSDTTILDWISSLDADGAAAANAILDRHELEAAQAAEPNTGLATLLGWLAEHPTGLQTAIVTRNSRPAAAITLERLGFSPHAVVTREDTVPKPDPAPVRLALTRAGLAPGEAVMIGDFRFDIEAGRAAGVAMTAFVRNGDPARDPGGADLVVDDLNELVVALGNIARG